MSAVANNPKFAEKVGVPTSVGKEFTGTKKYNRGGVMKQGYNARLDDSLGAKNGKKKQSMKSRRDESESMEKRKFAGDKAMKFQRGGVMEPELPPRPDIPSTPSPQYMDDIYPREPRGAWAMPETRKARRQEGKRTGRGRKAGGQVGTYKSGGKVRGAGKATKGVRSCKMVTMKGS